MQNNTCVKTPEYYKTLFTVYGNGMFYFAILSLSLCYVLVKIVPDALNNFLTDKFINRYTAPSKLEDLDKQHGGMIKKYLSMLPNEHLDKLILKLDTVPDKITQVNNKSIILNLLIICFFIIVIGLILGFLPDMIGNYCNINKQIVLQLLVTFIGVLVLQGIIFKLVLSKTTPIDSNLLMERLKAALLQNVNQA